jgi:hypothetical protein
LIPSTRSTSVRAGSVIAERARPRTASPGRRIERRVGPAASVVGCSAVISVRGPISIARITAGPTVSGGQVCVGMVGSP